MHPAKKGATFRRDSYDADHGHGREDLRTPEAILPPGDGRQRAEPRSTRSGHGRRNRVSDNGCAGDRGAGRLQGADAARVAPRSLHRGHACAEPRDQVPAKSVDRLNPSRRAAWIPRALLGRGGHRRRPCDRGASAPRPAQGPRARRARPTCRCRWRVRRGG